MAHPYVFQTRHIRTSLLKTPQLFIPPGLTLEEALAKPFHIYNKEFYDVIGDNPTLTLLAESASDPLYHEAVVW